MITLRVVNRGNQQFIRKFSKHKNVRVRFAPSPTGFLHLGGLRTALYNYLFAKANNGKFILRIEDTDQTRLVIGAAEQLQKDLEWAGIEIDEGPLKGGPYGPYEQSKRLEIYREHVKALLEMGAAYHCFCTDKRLDLLRKEALRLREIPKYDNRCRHLKDADIMERLQKGQPSCIRFKLNDKMEQFNDLIYGPIEYNVAKNEGDPVIIKSDGFPTYHFANVIDDHCMKISHVLRGVEWQISTTKHILIYKAFNWKPPQYGHLPLLLNKDGTKLSKRQGDIKIDYYRNNGIYPLALINYIIHSGGGFSQDLEQNNKLKLYNIDELSKQFTLKRINLHSGKLMPDLLPLLNRIELKHRLEQPQYEKEIINYIKIMLKNNNLINEIDEKYIKDILHWGVNRITKLTDLFNDDLKFIWIQPKFIQLDNETLENLKLFLNEFQQINLINKNKIIEFIKEFCNKRNIKYGAFMKALRGVLSGLKEGPSVAEMIEILGKETTVKRLDLIIKNTPPK